MKFTRLAVAIAALSASSAFAVPTFTVPGGQSLDPFGGFDYAQNGTAYTTNFNSAAAASGAEFSFQTTFFSYAVPTSGITDTAGNRFNVPNLVGGGATTTASTPFEITAVSVLNETGSCTGGGTNCTFRVTGGTFDIFLGTGVTLNSVTGAGAQLEQYSDGQRLIGGRVTGGVSTLGPQAQGSGGGASLLGVVEFTNATYINPALTGTSAVATLQVGSAQTNYVRPGFIATGNDCGSTGAGSAPTSCTLVAQADANQSFTFTTQPVPVPGTLALLGAAMVGLGFTARRQARH